MINFNLFQLIAMISFTWEKHRFLMKCIRKYWCCICVLMNSKEILITSNNYVEPVWQKAGPRSVPLSIFCWKVCKFQYSVYYNTLKCLNWDKTISGYDTVFRLSCQNWHFRIFQLFNIFSSNIYKRHFLNMFSRKCQVQNDRTNQTNILRFRQNLDFQLGLPLTCRFLGFDQNFVFCV